MSAEVLRQDDGGRVETVSEYGIAKYPILLDRADFWGSKEDALRRMRRFPEEGQILTIRTRTVIVTPWAVAPPDDAASHDSAATT